MQPLAKANSMTSNENTKVEGTIAPNAKPITEALNMSVSRMSESKRPSRDPTSRARERRSMTKAEPIMKRQSAAPGNPVAAAISTYELWATEVFFP